MPTAVSVAKQCLTPEAAHALDEAVAVARRRSHAQTTSLHVVSALLSLPASILRDACARARNSSYSPRLQFKALDLCLSVSLDRVQSGQSTEQDPPVSNALMAAIKRSQAHQRRLPENFRMYHEMSQQQNTVACVKVEIQQLILSILDDPSVNRVFAEAGFRSSEIKISIIRPAPQVFRYRDPPLFLRDVADNPGRTRLGFRYPGFPGLCREEDKTNRRIGEVLVRDKNRNPLLMGASAHDELNKFLESLEKKKHGVLPEEIRGLNAFSIENDVVKQITERFDRDYVDRKFEELEKLLEPSSASGVLVAYGDLEVFVKYDDKSGDFGAYQDPGGYLITRLAKFLKKYGKRAWLIGSASNDEVFSKFLGRYPSADQLWDVHVLTITSAKSCRDEFYPKSSLMESFVPFGGFFTSSSELKAPLTGSCKFSIRRLLRNEDSSQEILAARSPFADPYRSNSCLQMSKISDMKTKDDVLLRAGPQVPTSVGLQAIDNQKETGSSRCSTDTDEGQLGPGIQKRSWSFPGSFTVANSVRTDLGLRLCPLSETGEAKKDIDQQKGTTKNQPTQSSSCYDACSQIDPEDYKGLLGALTERVSWQEEATRDVSLAIAQQRARCNKFQSHERGDVWLTFIGADVRGKRKVASALAEILYASRDNFIHVDLASGEMSFHDFRPRGKTMVDCIFDMLRQRPLSVVFLEHVDSADEQLQSSLSRAIQTCKFLDSHGRALSVGNTTFITTLTSETEQTLFRGTAKSSPYSEEKILRAKRHELKILIEPSSETRKNLPSLGLPLTTNKRKTIGVYEKTPEDGDSVEVAKRSHTNTTRNLDLNLPAQEIEGQDLGDADSDHVHDSSHAWLQDFTSQTHMTKVTFEPFDFNRLAEKISDEIRDGFNRFFDSTCSLDIDTKVMEQLLAAAYESDRNRVIEDWVKQVLLPGFSEARRRCEMASHCSVKLVSFDQGSVSGEPTQRDDLLPCRVILN